MNKNYIQFLEKQQPLPALQWSDDLAKAANDHIEDCQQLGQIGHVCSDQSTFQIRIEKYGQWIGGIAENISYGQKTGEEGTQFLSFNSKVILDLIVDDGIRNRGHRKNVFKSQFTQVGIATGNHKLYRTSSVLVYADQFQKKIQT